MSDPSAPATALGVDIGGSAIKSAPVDVVSGHLLRARQRVLTPNPSTPKAVGEVVGGLVIMVTPGHRHRHRAVHRRGARAQH